MLQEWQEEQDKLDESQREDEPSFKLLPDLLIAHLEKEGQEMWAPAREQVQQTVDTVVQKIRAKRKEAEEKIAEEESRQKGFLNIQEKKKSGGMTGLVDEIRTIPKSVKRVARNAVEDSIKQGQVYARDKIEHAIQSLVTEHKINEKNQLMLQKNLLGTIPEDNDLPMGPSTTEALSAVKVVVIQQVEEAVTAINEFRKWRDVNHANEAVAGAIMKAKIFSKDTESPFDGPLLPGSQPPLNL